MEIVIRFNRDEQRTIVRGLDDMCNAMDDSDSQKRVLAPGEFRQKESGENSQFEPD